MTTPILQTDPIYYLPRPDRFYRQFKIRQRPSSIAVDLLQDILTEYSFRLHGQVKVPISPGRSESLILETPTGRKMLKRYKDTIAPATVLHEHSILNYLAQIDFPAPRLTPAVNGKTLIQKGGGCYALFDFLEGYFQYHDYFFRSGQTRQFLVASGKALGALHNALRNFDPEGYNPNGFKSREGARWRELCWFTDKLDWCRQEVPRLQTDDSHVLSPMFSKHANWVEEKLHQLNDILKAAAPPRLIIHGDYGPYNLFFKRGAHVVILDFELSRLDWRLTDLFTALRPFASSRMGFNFSKLRYFLKAYQSCCPIDPEELHLLPTVGQFFALRRVIICWYQYCSTRAKHWLIEAQHKLNLAHWLIKNQTTLSGFSMLD